MSPATEEEEQEEDGGEDPESNGHKHHPDIFCRIHEDGAGDQSPVDQAQQLQQETRDTSNWEEKLLYLMTGSWGRAGSFLSSFFLDRFWLCVNTGPCSKAATSSSSAFHQHREPRQPSLRTGGAAMQKDGDNLLLCFYSSAHHPPRKLWGLQRREYTRILSPVHVRALTLGVYAHALVFVVGKPGPQLSPRSFTLQGWSVKDERNPVITGAFQSLWMFFCVTSSYQRLSTQQEPAAAPDGSSAVNHGLHFLQPSQILHLHICPAVTEVWSFVREGYGWRGGSSFAVNLKDFTAVNLSNNLAKKVACVCKSFKVSAGGGVYDRRHPFYSDLWTSNDCARLLCHLSQALSGNSSCILIGHCLPPSFSLSHTHTRTQILNTSQFPRNRYLVDWNVLTSSGCLQDWYLNTTVISFKLLKLWLLTRFITRFKHGSIVTTPSREEKSWEMFNNAQLWLRMDVVLESLNAKPSPPWTHVDGASRPTAALQETVQAEV